MIRGLGKRVSRIRLHIPPERWAPRLKLAGPERRHLVDVLRSRVGQELEVFDGQGSVAQAILAREGDALVLDLGPAVYRPDRGPVVSLGIAMLKGRKLDQVVRMVTETGVTSIELFTCARSVSRPSAAQLKDKLLRWKAISVEAARQSGRSTIPTLGPGKTLEQVLQETSADIRALLYEGTVSPTLNALLDQNPTGARFVLVGPEGGFTEDEVARAEKAGFTTAGLGLPVLKAETAAVVAAAFACLDRKPMVE